MLEDTQEAIPESGVKLATRSFEATRSRTPNVYVPRRFRIGGIEGIRTGSAIVGTPQGGGMVAIDVESTPYVEPKPEVWSTWVAEAARRHGRRGRPAVGRGEAAEPVWSPRPR